MPKRKPIRVVYRAPNGEPEVKTITESLEAMRELLNDGYLEATPLMGTGLTLYCDEEGKLKNLAPNLSFYPNDVIVGPIFIAGKIDGQGYHKDLTDQEIEAATHEIRVRSMWWSAEKL